MNAAYDAEIRRVASALADIAHTLDSTDQVDKRVERVFERLHDLLRYDRCTLLHAPTGEEAELYITSQPTPQERAETLQALRSIMLLVTEAEARDRTICPGPHLTLPLMGLDEVIGVLRVESGGAPYDLADLRLLSVVAAQLGAYLTVRRLRDLEARRARELEMANDFQQLLLGIVSHDLRNPLNVILMAGTTMLRNAESHQQAQLVERSIKNAKLATRIVGDLIDLTRIRVTGTLPVTRTKVNLREVLESVILDTRLAHPARKIVLDESTVPVFGDWDSDRLVQVATNLLGNAISHGDPASPIRVSLTARGATAEISIHNHGPVIPAEVKETIFDPFRRGKDGRQHNRNGGLGLGLYIVAEIAKAHGGDARVESDAVAGTTFTVSLPRNERALTEAPDGPQGANRRTPSAA